MGGVKWVIDSVLGGYGEREGVVVGLGMCFLRKKQRVYLMSLTSTSLFDMA